MNKYSVCCGESGDSGTMFLSKIFLPFVENGLFV